MRWDRVWGAMLVPWLFACGGTDQPASNPAQAGGTAGQPAASGAGGTAGGNAGGAGGVGGGGGGAVGAIVPAPQPECTLPAVACNGQCLEPGASANGCTYLVRLQTLSSMAVHEGDVFFAGSYPPMPPAETPASGLYRIDGGTLERTLLDTGDAFRASHLAFEGLTLYYIVPGSSSDPGVVRAVDMMGGGVAELVTGLDYVNGIAAIGGRVYFAASLQGDTAYETVHWVPAAGGEMTTTALASVNRFRANATLIAGSWNGDIRTALLPDLPTQVDVLGDFELSLESWWIDDAFVYWQNDSAFKRLPLDAANATEEQGELVDTLPATVVAEESVGTEMLLSATNAGATGIYVRPISGGALQEIGVIGAESLARLTADANYAYVSGRGALLRLDR